MGLSQGGQGNGSLFTEINITPLTDIFLVLLIIMMVIAPMFQDSQKEIQVPQIKAGESVDDNKVVVEVTQQGQAFVNGKATTQDAMAAALTERQKETGLKQLVVRADKATQSKDVLAVFEAAGAAGFEKLTIAGDPLTTARQSELETTP